ncbi:MAG TPA: heavy metal-binding domain-containing protein [Longimicrobiales bacterium]|nr:heavy metal-binding domain-containing protein [Longimicrobiales bacterium]
MIYELLPLLLTPVLLLGAWATGGVLERRNLKDLHLLEHGSRDILAITLEDPPAHWEIDRCELVMGSVVISQDYFKRFVASLKGVVGGNITVFEPLLERARREALIRMKGVAHARGYDTIINVRIETSTMARAGGNAKGTAGVEVLAFGTAIRVVGERSVLPSPATVAP